MKWIGQTLVPQNWFRNSDQKIAQIINKKEMLNDAIFFSGEKPKLKKIKLKISKTGIFVTSKIKKKKYLHIHLWRSFFFLAPFCWEKKQKTKQTLRSSGQSKSKEEPKRFNAYYNQFFAVIFFFFLLQGI